MANFLKSFNLFLKMRSPRDLCATNSLPLFSEYPTKRFLVRWYSILRIFVRWSSTHTCFDPLLYAARRGLLHGWTVIHLCQVYKHLV